MKFIAKTEIGGYKPGEEVPEEKALIWKEMYAESPVEEVSGKGEVSKEEKVEKPKDSSEPMLDDYLGRNAKVVIKNIKTDNLSEDSLENLLKLEEKNKNRPSVMDAIEDKLEEID